MRPHLGVLGFACATIAAPGCFSPEDTPAGQTDGETETGGSTTGSTTAGTTTSATSSTTTPTSTSVGTESTSNGSSSTTEPGSGSEASTATDESGPVPEACGNGQLDGGEGCDDNNTASGDGCSAACQDEALFCDPRVIGSYTGLGTLLEVDEAGPFVVVSDDSNGPVVALIDITDPGEPLLQDAINLPNNVTIIDLVGRSDRVFAVGDPLVTSFQISDGDLSVADDIDGSSQIGFEAALQGTTLYIADDSVTRIVNVAQVGAMNLASSNVNLSGVMFPSYDGMAASPGEVFVSVNGILGAFDISDALNPVLQGTLNITGGGPLLVTDDADYVLHRSSDGFGITDVTDPTDPAPVTDAVLPQGNISLRDIATRSDYVYASTSNGKVFTFDILAPDAPLDANELDIGEGAAPAVHAGEDFLYVIQAGELHLLADLPGYCEAICGNGTVEYPEQCDDGDLESGDECDADCTR